MPRVTDADVKEILDTDIDTTTFILAANIVVNNRLASNPDLSTADLKEIERWLAAHFACCGDPREDSIKVGGVGVGATFEGETGKYLDFTRYGQMAKLLDTTGTLRDLDAGLQSSRRTASVFVSSREELDSDGNPV